MFLRGWSGVDLAQKDERVQLERDSLAVGLLMIATTMAVIHKENEEVRTCSHFLAAMALSFDGEVVVDLLLGSEMFSLNDGT